MSERAAFLTLTLLGVAALVAGMVVTRLCWRADIPAYGRRTRSWHVLLHPGQYAQPHAVGIVRVLFVAGLAGVAGGLAVLIQKAAHDLAR